MTLVAGLTAASEWTHWRGPLQTGVAFDKNLPDKIAPNVIWRAPYGSRSTCLVFNDRVYFINYDAKKVMVGGKEEDVAESIRERVMCLDANTGKKIWEHTFPIFHTDIVTSRLGWTNMAADAETGYVYAHGTQGLFLCLDGKSGKVVWQKSMGEEYGRVSGYGGRITSPIVDEDLVILGMVNTSWGDQAKGGNRYVAFNKRTGVPMWWSQPAGVKGTYYSAPVIATIDNTRQLISGGADGSVYGIKVRTGEPIWRYVVSENALNAAPVVDGKYVYIGHGEESPGTPVQGRVVCLDVSKLSGGEPELVWKVDGILARYASPIVHEGRLYVPDEGGRMYCLDGKTGKEQWRVNYGRGETRSSPVLADGKIYVGEVSARFHILKPEEKKCKKLDMEFFPGAGGVDVEVNGTPAVANGRVYFSTSEEIICIGTKEGAPGKAPILGPPGGKPGNVRHIQVIPADVTLYAGQSASFKALGFDVNGDFVSEMKVEWSLPEPTPPPGAKTKPPALKGAITPDGKLTLDSKMASQQGYVLAKFEGITGRARVRVAPKIPYANDFEKVPDGAVPGGWVNTQGKFIIKTVEGNKVLAKVNDKFTPLISRGHAYITMPDSKDYTIECDVQGTQVGKELPEIGIGANRYTLILAGNVQKLRLMSWDALPRIDKTIQYEFKPGVWYRMKLTTEMAGGKGIVKGKVWPRGSKEPLAWDVEVNDSNPITEGSATLYGYVTGNFNDKPGTEVYYDNLNITPNGGPNKKVSVQPDFSPFEQVGIVECRPALFPLFARLRR